MGQRADTSGGPRQYTRPQQSGTTGQRPPGAGPFGKRSTRRIAVLAAVLILLVIMILPTLRAYLRQQQEFDDLQAHVRDQQRTLTQLDEQQKRWQDPAYVEAQARERLKFVRPGERSYEVIGAESLLGDPLAGRAAVVDPAQGRLDQPWYGRMWTSVVATDSLGEDRSGVALRPVGMEPPIPTASPGAGSPAPAPSASTPGPPAPTASGASASRGPQPTSTRSDAASTTRTTSPGRTASGTASTAATTGAVR